MTFSYSLCICHLYPMHYLPFPLTITHGHTCILFILQGSSGRTFDIITQTAVMVTLPCPAFTPAWLTCSAPELKEPPPPPPFPFFAPALPPVYPPPPPPPPASGLPPPPPKPPHGPKRWATSKFTHIQQNRGT